MLAQNKNILKNFIVLLILLYGIFMVVGYLLFKDYALQENKAKLDDLLMHNKALHTYVEGQLKPVLYNLQENGILTKDFFDPKVLSFTYISRHVMDEYNNEREKVNKSKIIYKIAATNPRNPFNQADPLEKEILEQFQKGDIKSHQTAIIENNEEYMFYALPVTENKESCMRCHSLPNKAPKDLVDLYGDKAGFGEK